MSTANCQNPELELFENLENNQYAAQILRTFGPSLDELNKKYETKAAISSLTCADFINKIDSLPAKEIKFTGQGKDALLNAFSFILLAIGSKQMKYYPHLISIIKEQFFKPGVFAEFQPIKRNKILNIIRNIEIQLISSGSVSQFLGNNEQFLEGFQHILNKILQSSQKISTYEEIVQVIRKRFNIDSSKIQVPNSHAKCWILGMQKKIYLFEEKEYFIIVSASTSAQPIKNMNESAIQNRIQSERQVSEGGQQIIVEASQESTPKFKQNQQSIRYRKKSHKNSFGGDFQITGYKQLASLINRSQHETQGQKKQEKVRKIFSLKFQMQQMGCLTMQQQSPNHGKKVQNQNQTPINVTKNQFPMRGSNIQGNQCRLKERTERKKHITSSQVFNLMNRYKQKSISSQPEKLQQQQSNTNSNKNSINYQNKNTLPTASEKQIQNNTNESIESKKFMNMGLSNMNYFNFQTYGLLVPNQMGQKEQFKFSFSKKDASRFVFKEIQSQYNDNDIEQDMQLDTEAQIQKQLRSGDIKALQLSIGSSQPLRSSLTQLKSSPGSMGLLSQGEYFKKRQKNRQSLLLETTISPIQQEVQSSQRQQTQQHSITQSQKQIQNSYHQQLQKKSNTSYNNKIFGQNNPNNGWVSINNVNNKNFISIFKSKNRKFSYLTQPMSTSKNSLFNENGQELRQSDIEEGNQTIPESPENVQNNNHPSFIHNSKGSKNRVSKSPKKIHKNSEAVTESKPKKRRFEQNPISFSQMLNMKDDSNFSIHQEQNNKRVSKLSLNSNITKFIKNNIMCYNEPEGWIRKQVIYYFAGNGYQMPKPIPERYIIDRTFPSQLSLPSQFAELFAPNGSHNHQNKPLSSYQNSHQNHTEPCNKNNANQNQSQVHKEASIVMTVQNTPNLITNLPIQQNTNMKIVPHQTNIHINLNKNQMSATNPSNNKVKIRSTIDTAITPPGTAHNTIVKNKDHRNLSPLTPTPTNLQTIFSSSDKQSQADKNKRKSPKEKGMDLRNSQVIQQEKVKHHKQYKDLQNIHLNLRKKRYSGVGTTVKINDQRSPEKCSQKANHLNISYPLSYQSNSLSLSQNNETKIKRNNQKERLHNLIYSPQHLSSNNQVSPVQSGRVQNKSFSPSKNINRYNIFSNQEYNSFNFQNTKQRSTQYTPSQSPTHYFNANSNHLKVPLMNTQTSPSQYSVNQIPPQFAKIAKPQPTIINNCNFYIYTQPIGTANINSMPVMPFSGSFQSIPGYLQGVTVGNGQREGSLKSYRDI